MSRYFEVQLSEVPEPVTQPAGPVKELPRKKRRIKKRHELRIQRRGLEQVVKLATSNKSNADIYKERVPIDSSRLRYYGRGEGLKKVDGIRGKYFQQKYANREKKIEWATEQSARAEMLLTEETGFLEADDGERTSNIKQTQLIKSVDITSASKHFDLNLQFGPYLAKYTSNGRHLLLGGRKGHLAAFDWQTKQLHCEINVMEEIFDIEWLRFETWFATAQKNWVYIYDKKGTELHCLKGIYKPLRLEFLPYHFLLSSASEEGYLTWLDVSIGQIVSQFNSKLGRLSIMTQNPYNAVLCTGHSKGIVAMWTPNSKEPVAKMLCHRTALTSVAVDPKGLFMATGAVDHSMNIWDIRNLNGPIQKYRLHSVPTQLNFSQKSFLSVAMGNVIEIYNDCCNTTAKYPYLRHRIFSTIGSNQFCPFEDVLGVGHGDGFTSILVPGAGEANLDAFENNPFQTLKQRREGEVKALLEKVPAEMISLDPFEILDVNVPSLKEKVEARNALHFLKPQKIDYTPRKRNRGLNSAKIKQIVREEQKKEFVIMKNSALKAEEKFDTTPSKNAGRVSVLDRFKPKKRR